MEDCALGRKEDRITDFEPSFVIPRAPTYFRSNSCSCSPFVFKNETGQCDIAVISYDFLNIFTLVQKTAVDNNGFFLSFKQNFKAHQENITAIDSCEKKYCGEAACFLATCAVDSFLKIWINSSGPWVLFDQCSLRKEIIPNAISVCTRNDSLLVLSCSAFGHIVVWNSTGPLNVNQPFIKKPDKNSAMCCCWIKNSVPGKGLLCLVGYKDGVVHGFSYTPASLANEENLVSLFKINAHDEEVCNIAVIYPNFVTSGRDATVKAWSIENGKCQHSTRIQHRRTQGNDSDFVARKAWIPIASMFDVDSQSNNSNSDPFSLLCDSKGLIHSWNGLEKPVPLKSTSTQHSGVVFTINQISRSQKLYVSIGMHELFVWHYDSNASTDIKPVANHVFFSAKICTLTQGFGTCSPITVGLGDGSIALLQNVLPPAPNVSVMMTRLWPFGSAGKSTAISALAFNPAPQFENLLAFGSNKGHFDVIDITKSQKNSRFTQTKVLNNFSSAVYRVAWGPILFDNPRKTQLNGISEELTIDHEVNNHKSLRLFAYAVCASSIYLRLASETSPILLNSHFKRFLSHPDGDEKFTDIAFRTLSAAGSNDTYTCLVAIGSLNGAVNIFGKPTLSTGSHSILPLCRFMGHKKCINVMAWSNHMDRFLLAVGSNQSYITVSDVTEYAKKYSPEPVHLTNCLATLEGHGNRVIGIDWSTYEPDLFISCSFDCTAAVWRIGLGVKSAISSYQLHTSRVYGCVWNRQIADFVISGEDAGYLAGWRPSTQTSKTLSGARKCRLQSIPALDKSSLKLSPETPVSVSSSQHVEEKADLNFAEAIGNDQISNKLDSGSQKISNLPGKQFSLFPGLFATHSLSSDCSRLALGHQPPIYIESRLAQIIQFVSPMCESSVETHPEFDLLSVSQLSRKRLVKYVEQEAKNHLVAANGSNRARRLDGYFILLLWLGRAQLVASLCIELQHMPFWLMWALELMLNGNSRRHSSSLTITEESSSKSLSDDFLQQKVMQLRDVSGEYNKAATLLVCANRTVDAVRLLLSRGRAKEALVLFHLRVSLVGAASRNMSLFGSCLNILAERQEHSGLPHSVICCLADDRPACGVVDIILKSVLPSAPLIDHIAALWTAFSVLTSRKTASMDIEVVGFKLIYTCCRYAAMFDKFEEGYSFLYSWREVMGRKQEDAAHRIACWVASCSCIVLACATSADESLDCLRDLELLSLPPPIDIAQRLVSLSEDRHWGSDVATHLAHIAVDLAVARVVDNPTNSRLVDSLTTLLAEDSKLCANLTKNLSKCFTSWDPSFHLISAAF